MASEADVENSHNAAARTVVTSELLNHWSGEVRHFEFQPR